MELIYIKKQQFVNNFSSNVNMSGGIDSFKIKSPTPTDDQ